MKQLFILMVLFTAATPSWAGYSCHEMFSDVSLAPVTSADTKWNFSMRDDRVFDIAEAFKLPHPETIKELRVVYVYPQCEFNSHDPILSLCADQTGQPLPTMELLDGHGVVVLSSNVHALISSSHESVDYVGAHWDRYRIEFRLRGAGAADPRINSDVVFAIDKNCKAQ